MKNALKVIVFAFIFLFSQTMAFATPKIEVKMNSAVEITESVDGREVTKLLPGDTAEPGQVLQFTLTYANSGDEKATRVIIDNPVPRGTIYQVGSASGNDGEITFSIDNGKTFKQPSLLTYEVKEPDGRAVKKVASPEQYTDIRWIIAEIPPGNEGKVSFRVRVK